MDALSLWFKKVFASAVGSRSKANLESNREIFTNVYQNKLWGGQLPQRMNHPSSQAQDLQTHR
jgi:hypothetical protein